MPTPMGGHVQDTAVRAPAIGRFHLNLDLAPQELSAATTAAERSSAP